MSNNRDAEELARVIETMPFPLKSLKLDHPTLVTKLEALAPFLKSFVLDAIHLAETRKRDEVLRSFESFIPKIAEALSISLEDSAAFCTYLVMCSLMATRMGTFMAKEVEKKEWEGGMEKLWNKS